MRCYSVFQAVQNDSEKVDKDIQTERAPLQRQVLDSLDADAAQTDHEHALLDQLGGRLGACVRACVRVRIRYIVREWGRGMMSKGEAWGARFS